MTTLLLLGVLASAGSALACVEDDAAALLACASSFVGPDGEKESYHVGPYYTPPQDTVNTHPVCIN